MSNQSVTHHIPLPGDSLQKETTTMNLGPTHPATHGVFQNILELSGETIMNAEQTVGYIHRAFEKLAERPCALRRIAGQNWIEIEKDLAVTMPQETAFEARVAELIDTRAVDQCADKGEWVSEIARML